MPEVLILNTDDCCYGVLRVRARCLAPPPASVRREMSVTHDLDNLGGHSGGDTPLPIPNREVKPASADGTRGASPRESRTPPSLFSWGNEWFPHVPPPSRLRHSESWWGSRRAEPGSALERHSPAIDDSVVPRISVVEIRDGDLVLRPWVEGDVPALVAACNDPEITRWIPVIPSPYTEADAFAFVRGEPDGAPEHSFAITVDKAVVGAIGMALNAQGYRGRIGYWTAAPGRGRGYCTRALRDLSWWAFDDLAVRRLELITDPDNVASQRVAEKAGFAREGVMRSHLLHPDGRLRDSVMFSLLPGELRER